MLLAVLLCPALALAESREPDYSRPGFFVGFGMAVGSDYDLKEQWEDILDPPDNSNVRVDAAVGYHVRAGYRIIPRLAAEAEFEWLPGFDVKLLDDQKLVDTQSWLLTANAKGYLLADTRFQPFVLIGLGYYQSHGQYNLLEFPSLPPAHYETLGDFAARFGGGFDAYLTEKVVLAFDVNFVLGTGEVEDLDYLSVGLDLQYRF